MTLGYGDYDSKAKAFIEDTLDLTKDGAFLEPENLNGTNRLEIFVFANDAQQQALVIARLDNLGKGASGAAVQNLNLMLGSAGLKINPFGKLLILGNVLFPIGNGGLQDKLTPVVGIDYSF